MKISKYQSLDHLDFFDIAGIIGEGRPVIGKVRIDNSFALLKPGEIYNYDPEDARKTETGEHCSYALVFVGYYGWRVRMGTVL